MAAAATAGACAAQGLSAPLARPLALQPLPPGSRMEPLGGLVLNGGDVLGFTGLSGLHLSDSLQLTAVSDLGHWTTARLVLEGGRPVGLEAPRTGRLRDGAGQPLLRGHAGDAEALARQPDGTWLVAFERWHRIRAYTSLDSPGLYVEAPPGLELAPVNGGLEALAVLEDGRWLAFAETLAPPGGAGLRRAWLGRPGGGWTALAYRPAEGFEPADAAPLPEGGALVLERRFSVFSGFEGRLVRLSAPQLREARAGDVLEGEEVLRLARPLPTENYEAVGVARHGGRTLMAVLSDDNENPLQRTLLLLFALGED